MTFLTGDIADGRDERRLPDLVSRSSVIAKLRARLQVLARERFALEPSTPGGRVLAGAEREHDLSDRRMWNAAQDDNAAWLRATIAELETGRTVAGLRELRDAVPTVTEAVSVFVGEGG